MIMAVGLVLSTANRLHFYSHFSLVVQQIQYGSVG